ncbi:hypothetical protein N0V93_000799 [Gnomoniopsis smithogilvyi]|uniref:Uncharacterized protein n=1 Tax=Gnomoniopsis smithogilvyi TaxID=1191159 RepID=A0A9W8Z2N3_9PEZI|nr:hypothetical protein N0V93_000799 [Gnomoniopsis smithogilvyi]
MNWNEGTLFRHSRPSKGREVLLRQKEYFAKVRAGNLSTKVKNRTPSISFLARPALPPSASHHSLTSEAYAPSCSKKRSIKHDPARISRYFSNDDGLELPTVANFQEVQVGEEALRQKRRKLLLKGDWTGINLQKPIEMEFSKPRASHSGPWSHLKSRHAKSKSKMCDVLGTKCDARQARDPKVLVKTTDTTSPIQMRVRVGNRERVFGGSSTQSRTFIHVESSPQGVCDVRSFEDLWSEPTQDERRLLFAHPASIPDAHHQSPKLPELHQPLPQRPFPPSLFRSPSSNPGDSGSTIAQVGVLEPDVPSSLMKQNEAWWSFVGTAEQSQFASDLEPSDCEAPAVQREISPGISQFDPRKTNDDANREIELAEKPAASNTKATGHRELSVQRQEDILPAHELESFVVPASVDCDVFPIDNETSSSSMGSELPPTLDIWQTGKNVSPAHHAGFHDADEVSLQVIPTSCSPPSEELLPKSHNYTDFRSHIDDIIEPSTLPGSQLPDSDQESLQPPHLHKDAMTDQEQVPKPLITKESNIDLWRDFVLGDYDNNIQELFEEARKETARNLQPSDPPTNVGEDGDSETTRLYVRQLEKTVALHSGPSVDAPNITIQYDSSSTQISSTTPVSHIADFGDSSSDPLAGPDSADSCIGATVGDSSPEPSCASDLVGSLIRVTVDSSPDPLSAPALAHTDNMVQTDELTAGSSDSSKSIPLSVSEELLSRNGSWSLVTGGNDDASLVAHPPSEAKHTEAENNFKFARPKPFLGKKKAHLDEQRQIALSAPQIRGRGVTWRRQKRTSDGRTSIRHVPNFSSDPIEEVEDAMLVKGAQQPSLFGSLDTNEDLC